ncbi:DinB family protein [Capnocytophaga catalasegens]|uniref:DinB-like domain-containing protein n=1 Tax=Capnocytophaga catalasegens TaxID=1004260 RepID=A0AAV5AX44_9FLAO|nr:DinB family protein [Capnocytophaga catalasegens]GIZ14859.1 hypothetical protein RCZ03_08590 [Capnocytophaga catalasegens]GJM49237.1 hypothetical protein RCZ15_02120 [Capnocytophaga catalasegens]GJM52387.1 hypothetical protein RCZ16_07040 [Capnocytophaga catalasegens]
MDSNTIFDLHKITRGHLITYLDMLSPEQLAYIPEGFRNNIFWNIAHCVVTQQLLCYKFSELPLLISDTWVQKYCKGTIPTGSLPSQEEIQELRELLISTQKQLQQDYQQGKFVRYTAYTTSYGFSLNSIDEALLFNNTHEAMHLGIIKSLSYFK